MDQAGEEGLDVVEGTMVLRLRKSGLNLYDMTFTFHLYVLLDEFLGELLEVA